MSRITQPTTGKVFIKGRVASLLEVGTGFHPELTGRENIFLNGAIMGMSRAEIKRKFDEIVDFAELDDAIDAPVQTYSSGMYVRLGFAVAAQLNPDILLVDEILAVGDMSFRVKCMNRIWTLLRSGVGVILVSHNMYHIQAFSTYAILLEKGKVKCHGEPGLVVSEYENLVASRAIKLSQSDSTGPLKFESISLASDGRELNLVIDSPTIETHRPFRIRIQYELRDRILGGIQIGLIIKNAEGHRIAGFTTGTDATKLPGEPGRYQICFDFDENLLLNGQYHCGLSSFNLDYTHNLGHWENAAKFRVRTPGHNGLSSVGNVFLPHRVTVSGLTT